MSIIGNNPYAAFAAAQPTTLVTAAEKTAKTDQSAIADGVSGFKAAMETAEKAAIETAMSGADPHAMVEALANAEMVLNTAVTMRDKVVEAYQELLRMPV
jgi:flagellar hook-basal body complex protein FliE